MALETWTNSNRFKFPNGNEFILEYENCDSYSDVKKLKLNGKTKSFKGSCKAQAFFNKNNELDGIIVKIKNSFGLIYYIAVNQNKMYFRLSLTKCLELIPTSIREKKKRIQSTKNLKVN
jgi:hypothetical protein